MHVLSSLFLDVLAFVDEGMREVCHPPHCGQSFQPVTPCHGLCAAHPHTPPLAASAPVICDGATCCTWTARRRTR